MRSPFTPKTFVAFALVSLFIFISATAQQKWQWPDKAKNLKVLPKNTTGEELHAKMKEYARSLGVRCLFCHKGEEGQPFSEIDFASDEKPAKETARKMIKMTEGINKKYMDKMGAHGFDHISCVTCHHGSPHPILSVDSLMEEKH